MPHTAFADQTTKSFPAHCRNILSLHPTDYTGELVRLLVDISSATRLIDSGLRRSGIPDSTGNGDIQNEILSPKLGPQATLRASKSKEFDAEAATRILFKSLYHDGYLCAMLSNTADELLAMPDNVPFGSYALTCAPLERDPTFPEHSIGGTIFAVFKRTSLPASKGALSDLLRKGSEQVAAGYVLYGNSTVLTYTVGHGTYSFRMDPNIKEYFLASDEPLKIPASNRFTFINKQETAEMDDKGKKIVDYITQKELSVQYSGNLVNDVHHHLSCGGFSAFPPTKTHPSGTVHYLCEAAPIAFLVEQAGGKASTGTERVLDVKPKDINQRTPFYFGSSELVDAVEALLKTK
eukprot:tig00000133_g7713.t1